MKLLFVLCFGYWHCFAQLPKDSDSANFIVMRNHEEIGTLTVERQIEGNNTSYSLFSSVQLKALVNVQIHETIVSEFNANELTTALHKRVINGFHSADKVVTKSGKDYVCDDEILPHLGSSIQSSVLLLYFHEPKTVSRIFSESFAEMVTLRNLGEGIYSLKLPNDSTTDYYYENGMLVKVNAHTRWGIITFQRETPLASR